MRTLAYFTKTFVENLREWRILAFVLVFGPAFIFMMFGYYGAADPAYSLLVVNRDVVATSDAGATDGAQGLIDAWSGEMRADGQPYFELSVTDDLDAARQKVKNRQAELLVEIPAGFGDGLAAFGAGTETVPARLVNYADPGNLRGAMAMAVSDYVAFTYAFERAGVAMPLEVSIKALGAGGSLDEFELMVPALLMLSIIMILFTAAASMIKETDKGTMVRLTLSRLRLHEFLAAISINQVLLGLVALVLAFLAAFACGYRSEGSYLVLLSVGALTTLGVVAIALITAAFLKSMFELLTVGVFPFFILMFFSECMFPLPKIRLIELAGHMFYANDVLPTTLGVRAFTKVLNNGAGFSDLTFELAGMLVLTFVYFSIGIWLFHRRHQRV